MKLKAYSRNNPLKHSVLHTVKRYLWLPFVILALSIAVFVVTELVMENGMLSSSFLQQSDIKIYFVFNNTEIWEVFPLFLIAISFFSAYVMFSFLFKKKSSTMMLLTGISRTELFVSRYVFGLSSTLIPALISFFIMLVLGADNVESSLTFNKDMLMILFMFVLLIVFAYTISATAMTLCGRKLEFLAVFAVFTVGGLAILLFVGVLFNTFVHGFAYPIRTNIANFRFSDMFDKYCWVSPYGIFKDAFNVYSVSGVGNETSLDVYSDRLVWFSVITGLLIPLSAWLFKRRNAEYDEKSNANKFISAVCSIIPALTLSSLVLINSGSLLMVIISLLLFTLLSMLFYAFFNGTIRNIFKSFKFITPVTAIFALFILALNLNLIGYSKKIPPIDDIESVTVSYKGKWDNGFDGSSSSIGFIISHNPNWAELPVLTAKEDIQTVMNIHQKIIDDGSITPSIQTLDTYSDTAVYVDYNIVYKLKNGKEIIRTYSVMKLSTLYSTLEIETTSAYREKISNIIKAGNGRPFFNKEGNLFVNYDSINFFASDNMLSNLTEISLNSEDKALFLESVISDKLNETVEETYHPSEDCLGVIWLSKPKEGGSTLNSPNYITVNKNNKNILSFLESKGLENVFNTTYEIKSIKLYSYNYYGRDYVKEMSIDRSYMANYNINIFDQPSLFFDLGEVPKEDWEEVLHKSYLSYFRDVGNKYAVITMTNANGKERVVTKFIPE